MSRLRAALGSGAARTFAAPVALRRAPHAPDPLVQLHAEHQELGTLAGIQELGQRRFLAPFQLLLALAQPGHPGQEALVGGIGRGFGPYGAHELHSQLTTLPGQFSPLFGAGAHDGVQAITLTGIEAEGFRCLGHELPRNLLLQLRPSRLLHFGPGTIPGRTGPILGMPYSGPENGKKQGDRPDPSHVSIS
jgi:hypothetical protein